MISCVIAVAALRAVPCTPQHSPVQFTPSPKVERVWAVRAADGVYAYARISPDGTKLAYASEEADSSVRRGVKRTVTIVDLEHASILFTEPGIDAYWSPDGQQIIYESRKDGVSVSVRKQLTGEIIRDVVPPQLGDYYSWGESAGKNIILTIANRFFTWDGRRAALPAAHVPSCDGIGVGERPLLSKDGTRITTFVAGNIVVRDLTDCANIVETGVSGAKADFSFDGRFIAFHAPKMDGTGYEIQIVDIEKRTLRRLALPTGSSLFPSWTKDGRLCFRYDGPDYRGFLMASDVLAAKAEPLPKIAPHSMLGRQWEELFPGVQRPTARINVVLVWSTWSAHSTDALSALQGADRLFRAKRADVSVQVATDPASQNADVERVLAAQRWIGTRITMSAAAFGEAETVNQMPLLIVFVDGSVVTRLLGAPSIGEIETAVLERTRVDSARTEGVSRF